MRLKMEGILIFEDEEEFIKALKELQRQYLESKDE